MWTYMTGNFNVLSNHFYSTLPTELGRMTRMTSYYVLRANSFSGTIPTQVSEAGSGGRERGRC